MKLPHSFMALGFLGLMFLSGCNIDLTTWTITVNNLSTSESICYVKISSSSSSSWGSDELGSSETVAPGESRSFSEFEGTVDMQVEGCSGTITENFGIELYEDVSFDWVGL